ERGPPARAPPGPGWPPAATARPRAGPAASAGSSWNSAAASRSTTRCAAPSRRRDELALGRHLVDHLEDAVDVGRLHELSDALLALLLARGHALAHLLEVGQGA